MACNGDSTTGPKAFADLSGIMTTAQLPSGTPSQSSVFNLIGQAANIGVTPVLAVATTGFYRLTVSIKRTQIATTSSTLPSVTVAWTEGDNSAAGSSAVIGTNATNTLIAVAPSILVVWAKAGTNITYTTSGYASVGAAVMQYALRIKCEAI